MQGLKARRPFAELGDETLGELFLPVISAQADSLLPLKRYLQSPAGANAVLVRPTPRRDAKFIEMSTIGA
jgi:hypothetical protein